MLAGEHRRRRGDRHLLARQRGDGGGPQRDLGLAIADIADHQPVHRPSGGQVAAHRLDRGALVGRFREGKARREALIGGGFGVKHRRGAVATRLGKLGQPARGFGDGGIDAGTPLLPALAVQRVERDRIVLRAIAPQAVGVSYGHQPHRVARIGQLDRVAARGRIVPRQPFQPRDGADTMILMDYGVADANLGGLQQRGLDMRHDAVGSVGTAADQVRSGDGEQALRPKAAIGGRGERQQRPRRSLAHHRPVGGRGRFGRQRLFDPAGEEA